MWTRKRSFHMASCNRCLYHAYHSTNFKHTRVLRICLLRKLHQCLVTLELALLLPKLIHIANVVLLVEQRLILDLDVLAQYLLQLVHLVVCQPPACT